MTRRILALALVATLAAALPAVAEEIDLGKLLSDDWSAPAAGGDDAEADAEAQKKLSATYCDMYGPDYELVPGTTTCIRVGGHVQMDVYIRGRR